jgi:hypothetical protein
MNPRIILSAALACCTLSAQAADPAPELLQYVTESRAAALPFLRELNEANKKAIGAGGPESAIDVCKEIAPKMAGDVSRRTGWKLSRVSAKVRNPLLGTPDRWERQTLEQFEARLAKGEPADAIERAEVLQEGTSKSFRYMKAIVLQQGCVACHGQPEQLAPGVQARLSRDYPHDKATGYLPGQLRGALSIQRALE